MKSLVVVIVALIASASVASAETKPGPKGWYLYEVVSGEYAVEIDRTVARGGRASARLAAVIAAPTRYGLLGQVIDAAPYHGKRVRFSGFVRTDKVAKWGGLFMRVDSPDRDPKRALALDAMERRPIRGTTSWTRVEIVLDVAPEASQIALGVTLTGAGVLWIDDVRFEIVDRSVPTTNYRPPDKPQNIDFED
jgi:hypothetical protein